MVSKKLYYRLICRQSNKIRTFHQSNTGYYGLFNIQNQISKSFVILQELRKLSTGKKKSSGKIVQVLWSHELSNLKNKKIKANK
jgi:hypothetical protein